MGAVNMITRQVSRFEFEMRRRDWLTRVGALALGSSFGLAEIRPGLADDLALTAPTAGDLPLVKPETAGLKPDSLARINPLIEAAITNKKLPGCVLAIGRRGRLVWLQAYGNRQLEPHAEPMTVDTLFDLASLTKPVATAASILKLSEQGRLKVTDLVADHWPEFARAGKERLTLLQLLTHTSGLLADNPLRDYADGPPAAFERICQLGLKHPPAERFLYSDVNFLVLGQIVARVAGQSVHEFSRSQLFEPLGLRETGFTPEAGLRARCAPTERRGSAWMKGEVHDPRAHLLGGVAGHAGLFSTVADLSRYADMLLGRGERGGVRVLSEAAWELFTGPRDVPLAPAEPPRTKPSEPPRNSQPTVGRRALGWDVETRFTINRGAGSSPRAFGHGGFTGTALWVDPERDLFFVFLSNRVHPNGKGEVNSLAGQLGEAVWGAA